MGQVPSFCIPYCHIEVTLFFHPCYQERPFSPKCPHLSFFFPKKEIPCVLATPCTSSTSPPSQAFPLTSTAFPSMRQSYIMFPPPTMFALFYDPLEDFCVVRSMIGLPLRLPFVIVAVLFLHLLCPISPSGQIYIESFERSCPKPPFSLFLEPLVDLTKVLFLFLYYEKLVMSGTESDPFSRLLTPPASLVRCPPLQQSFAPLLDSYDDILASSCSHQLDSSFHPFPPVASIRSLS